MNHEESDPQRRDAVLALVLGTLGTWALPRFLLVPLFEAFGLTFGWWTYVIVFVAGTAGVYEAVAKPRAVEVIAYGPPRGTAT